MVCFHGTFHVQRSLWSLARFSHSSAATFAKSVDETNNKRAKEDDDEAAWREFSVICIKGFLEHIQNTPSARVERENRRIFNSSSSFLLHLFSCLFLLLLLAANAILRLSSNLHWILHSLLLRHLRFRITIFNFTWALFAGARLSLWVDENASLTRKLLFPIFIFDLITSSIWMVLLETAHSSSQVAFALHNRDFRVSCRVHKYPDTKSDHSRLRFSHTITRCRSSKARLNPKSSRKKTFKIKFIHAMWRAEK